MGGATRCCPLLQVSAPWSCDNHVTRVCPQARGELVGEQKVGADADGCTFAGLRAGSLYRLQVASWSRRMSSDSSTLARTGESVGPAPEGVFLVAALMVT